MHASQRDSEILRLLQSRGFVSFRQLSERLDASSATIRRDLERLESEGRIARVRGGARLIGEAAVERLVGAPFELNRGRYAAEKAAIGRAAARIWRSTGNTLSSHQRATSGNDSNRSVSPVGAQSTTITSHSPAAW